MKPFAVLAAIALLLLAGPFPQPALAAAAPAGPLVLELEQLTPRVVTADGPQAVTVTGVLRNTGDRPIGALQIRLQRGGPLSTEGAVRDALDGRDPADAVSPRFFDLPEAIAPGGTRTVRLSVPLQGPPETSLALPGPGVYELLVNVNGVPEGGDRARLAAVRMLLPVLEPPSDGEAGAGPDTPAGPPLPVSLLVPVVDSPRRLPTVPGERTLLTDDDLAASFAPGGRLRGLVDALAAAAAGGSPVRDAICLAIDPDLVQTAEAMRAGYEVRGPDGVVGAGAGAEAAGRWLDDLAAVARDGCVLALPFADADVVALTRGGLGEQARAALADGEAVLAQVLGAPVLDGVTWPVAGLLDEPTLAELAAAGGQGVVLAADAVEGSTRAAGVVPVADGGGSAGAAAPLLGILSDPLLTRAATGPDRGDDPVSAAVGAASASTSPAGAVGPLSTQDLVGAIAFRAGSETPAGGPLVVAPPHQWAVDGDGATALFESVDRMMADRLLTPRDLAAVAADGAPLTAGPRRVAYPIRDADGDTPVTVVDDVRRVAADIADLASAATDGGGVGASPEEVFAPLRQGVVRPASSAWRERAELAERHARL
ncbi:MAG TPA: hypothetical protein VD813_01165, partial [Pseudonocardia sp.]|nr:hypothetical protein [Pseudonocardia sp.]